MPADAAFTVKCDGRTFVLDKITLGDWRMWKTEFGLSATDIVRVEVDDKGNAQQALNLGDPSVLVGLMVAALHHERPHASIKVLTAEIDGLSMEGLEFPGAEEDEPEAEAAPLDDASEATVSPAKGGSSGKPQKKPGRQSSQKS